MPQSGPSGVRTCDRSTSTALDACFAVGGIGDQAVGAQRSPLLVAGRGLADRPAPATGLGAGLGGAVAAQPLPVDSPVQVNDSTAAGAGRADDRARSGVAQGVDKAQHRPCRCFGAGAGEQLGPVLQRPGKLMTVPGPGGRQPHRCGGDVGRQGRVGGGYHVDRELERVTPAVGRTRHAAWLSVAVPRVDRADSSALAARFADRTADSAVPVVAAALQRAQVFAALGAHRCRNARCASLVQRDQQVPDRARGGRAAVIEHSRPVAAGPGQAGAVWPGRRRHASTTPVTVGRSSPGSRSSTRSTTTPIGSASTSGANTPGNGQLSVAGDAGPFRPQIEPTPASAPPAARFFRAGAAAAIGSISSSIAAVEDVQQRHQDLQAQPLRAVHDQPVDLAGGQVDPALRQRLDQVGGGEHAARGHHLAQMPPVVEFARHSALLPAPRWVVVERWAEGLAQRGVHEVARIRGCRWPWKYRSDAQRPAE